MSMVEEKMCWCLSLCLTWANEVMEGPIHRIHITLLRGVLLRRRWTGKKMDRTLCAIQTCFPCITYISLESTASHLAYAHLKLIVWGIKLHTSCGRKDCYKGQVMLLRDTLVRVQYNVIDVFFSVITMWFIVEYFGIDWNWLGRSFLILSLFHAWALYW